VALPKTGGAVLAALGEGWAERGDFHNSVGSCRDENLPWRIELQELPHAEATRNVAYGIDDRLEDAWGYVKGGISRNAARVKSSWIHDTLADVASSQAQPSHAGGVVQPGSGAVSFQLEAAHEAANAPAVASVAGRGGATARLQTPMNRSAVSTLRRPAQRDCAA
jgi:hypothetical protein